LCCHVGELEICMPSAVFVCSDDTYLLLYSCNLCILFIRLISEFHQLESTSRQGCEIHKCRFEYKSNYSKLLIFAVRRFGLLTGRFFPSCFLPSLFSHLLPSLFSHLHSPIPSHFRSISNPIHFVSIQSHLFTFASLSFSAVACMSMQSFAS
jgi:hypothetical protein